MRKLILGGLTLLAFGLFLGSVDNSFSPKRAFASEVMVEPDSDNDRCPDHDELGTDPTLGGMRDPSNYYDFWDPTHNGRVGVDDILAVVGAFFNDDTDSNPGQPPYSPGYNPDTDRTSISGGDPWDLGPGNGQQRVDDILRVVKSYFHSCAGPTEISLDQIAPACDWNLKESGEAAGESVVPGTSYRECRLIRDATGQLIDVGIVDQTTSFTDVTYSDDPVDPSQVAAGIAPVVPDASTSGSTIGPHIWEFGCVTGHNKANSFWGYMIWNLELKECYAAVIDSTNPYYRTVLETGVFPKTESRYPYTLDEGAYTPALGQPPTWNVYARDFKRQRWGQLNYRPCCQNWSTSTIYIGVRIFWATDQHDYNSDWPHAEGVLGQILH